MWKSKKNINYGLEYDMIKGMTKSFDLEADLCRFLNIDIFLYDNFIGA
jgi:hypothetical protein